MLGMQSAPRWIVSVCFGMVAAVFGGALGAVEPPPEATRDRVELFEAIAAGDVSVQVVPQRSERVTLQVANKTDRPLSIEVPAAIAAAPVLAQLPGGGFNQPSADNAPQALGFPGMNNVQNGGNGNAAGFPFGMNGGLFNIPAGKTIKVKLPAACLEFSRREPSSRIPYQLKPIESVTPRSEVVDILAMINRKEVSRRVGQLAIWNIANGTSWREIANLKIDPIGGLVAPQYSSDEIRKAQQLVKGLTEPGEGSISTAANTSVRGK
jgi:hypothetical protein